MSILRNITMLAGCVLIGFAAPKAYAAELVTNGGFETPIVPTGTYVISNAVPGWTLGAGSAGSGIEIQNNVVGSPFEGSQFCELDSDGVTSIYQDLATTAGQTYNLSFAFSPRPGVDQNIMNVTWNGGLLDTLTASGVGNPNTVWNTHNYSVTATGATTRLMFDNLTEKSDSLGSYVDAVSVTTTAVPEPGSLAFLATGALSGLGLLRRRR